MLISHKEMAWKLCAKDDLYDKCPHCGVDIPKKATRCTDCEVTIHEWITRGGHKVLAYEERGQQ